MLNAANFEMLLIDFITDYYLLDSYNFNNIMIDNIIFKVNVTHGVCQKIITSDSNIVYIPYNITGQIGMNCRIDVTPILDGNTQSYIPFISSNLKFSLIQ